MIFTALHEAFFTYIKVAFWAACFVSFPVVASQIYMFVAPGLYKNEKAGVPAVPGGHAVSVLRRRRDGLLPDHASGLAVLPRLRSAGQREGSLAIVLEPKVNEYLALVMKLIFAFGLCFQLPVLLTLLAQGRYRHVRKACARSANTPS